MKNTWTRLAGMLKAAVVLALLFASVALSQHLVLHELHAHHHESAEHPESPAGPVHDHPLMTPSYGSLLTMFVSAAATVASLAFVLLRGPQTPNAVPLSARNTLRFGALRAGPDLSLQPLLATYLI